MEVKKHQELADSSSKKTEPPCISILEISSPLHDDAQPLPHANMARDLLKSHKYSPINEFPLYAVEGSEETWGVEDDDLTDPNFEGNGHSDPTSFDVDLSEYKKKATIIVEEYFGTNDVVSVDNELKELGMAEYRYYFVKKLVSMAMDRHDKEKEMAAFLLYTLYADVIAVLSLFSHTDSMSLSIGM